MEFKDISEEQLQAFHNVLKPINKELTEVLKIMEELSCNPKFKDKTFKEAIESKEFDEALKKSLGNKCNVDTNTNEIELLKSIIPKNFYITNNKLSNEMTKDFLDKGEQELIVIRSTPKKGDIITYNTLTYDDKNISIMVGKREFTTYDRAIHNAVCSLYVTGNDVVTPAMVYRTMNGMTETEHIDPTTLKSVTNSIDKSRVILLKVDFTKEAKARNINVEKTTIESYLLNADKIEVKVGGSIIEGYKINKMPVLYQYAQHTKQILSISTKLLDTKDVTRNTQEIIQIREYLVRRIEGMINIRTTKNSYTMSNKILYDTIFEKAGIIINHRTERDRYRKYIKQILNLWKDRDGYIRDFSEYKEKNSIKGIEIVVNKKR